MKTKLQQLWDYLQEPKKLIFRNFSKHNLKNCQVARGRALDWVAKTGAEEPKGWAWEKAEAQILEGAEFRATTTRGKKREEASQDGRGLGEGPVSRQVATLPLTQSSLDFSLIGIELLKLFFF